VSGIAGIVGRGSLKEVRSILARMSYRGPEQRAWSPAHEVYLGEVGYEVGTDGEETIVLAAPLVRLLGVDVSRTVLCGMLDTGLIGSLLSRHGVFAFAAVGMSGDHSVVLAVDQMAARSLYVLRLPMRLVFA